MTILRQHLAATHSELRHLHASTLDLTVQLQALSAPEQSPVTSKGDATLYLKIGLSIGAVLLLAIIVVAGLLVRKRQQHKRALARAEKFGDIRVLRETTIRNTARLSNGFRSETLISTPSRKGWTALSSKETFQHARAYPAAKQNVNTSRSSPALFKQRSISPLKIQRVQLLKAPRNRAEQLSRYSSELFSPRDVNKPDTARTQRERSVDDHVVKRSGGNIFTSTESRPLTDRSINSISTALSDSGTSVTQSQDRKTSRSLSLDSLATRSKDARKSLTNWRLSKHGRSISLSAPPTRPPSGPIPSLPQSANPMPCNDTKAPGGARKTVGPNPNSESTSAITTSPLLPPRVNYPTRSSRSSETLSWSDRGTSKTATYRQWQNPLVTGPCPGASPSTKVSYQRVTTVGDTGMSSGGERRRASLRESRQVDRLSSSLERGMPRGHSSPASPIKSDRMGVSHTPARAKRSVNTGVTSNRLPKEREQPPTLGAAPDDQLLRQISSETEDSGESRGRDLLRLTLNTPRPSALKGSPNARQGHRRQNTVRISSLTPQVFEPPTTRSSSQSTLPDILTKQVNGTVPSISIEEALTMDSPWFHANSNSAVLDSAGLRPMRTSLTPSSPTLSAWMLHYKDGLTINSQTSGSISGTSPSLNSYSSSDLMIPEFPPPAKSAKLSTQPRFAQAGELPLTAEQNQETIPESIADIAETPNPLSSRGERDTAWTVVRVPLTEKSMDDGRESPMWNSTDPRRGSSVLQAIADLRESLYGGGNSPSSYMSTPPLSPSAASGFPRAEHFSDDKGNISDVSDFKPILRQATLVAVEKPSLILLPGSSIPLPPIEDAIVQPLDIPTIRRRAASTSTHPPGFRTGRLLARPITPVHSSVSTDPRIPLDPRSEPAKSVLNNAMALRRMSSDMELSNHQEARSYSNIDHEASPSLRLSKGSADSEHQPQDADLGLGIRAPSNEDDDCTTALMDSYLRSQEDQSNRPVAELQHLLIQPYTPRRMPAPVSGTSQSSNVSGQMQPLLPLPRDILPRLASSLPSVRSGLPQTPSSRQRLRFPRVNGGGATPRSLYDADGYSVNDS